MDMAVVEERRFKTTAVDSKKRPASSNDQASDPKRPKLEQESNGVTSASFLAAFDFTSLPASLITDLIVANIEAFTESALVALVQSYRQSRGVDLSATIPPVSTAPAIASHSTPDTMATPIAKLATPPIIKQESVDPLQMDIDDEIEYEPDRLNQEVCYSWLPTVEHTLNCDLVVRKTVCRRRNRGHWRWICCQVGTQRFQIATTKRTF